MGFKKKGIRAATLADVGREAGVSAMAASAVLNGAKTSTRIANNTRARILAAAKRLNYRANVAARALSDRRMHTIGVVAVIEGGELNHYFLDVFNGILEGAREHSQNTTVFTLDNWADDSHRLLGFCDGRIDGMILICPNLAPQSIESLPRHTPFVAIHPNQSIHGLVFFESDEEKGAFAMVEHLIEKGHRSILHLSGSRGQIGAERRIKGYQSALKKALNAAPENMIIEAGFSIASGKEAMASFLRNADPKGLPDAVFCASDAIAVGAMEALAEKGIRVPDDISIAGFDDTLLARTTHPQLSTVHQPLRRMGCDAVDNLIRAIEHRDTEPAAHSQRKGYATELVIRASIADRS